MGSCLLVAGPSYAERTPAYLWLFVAGMAKPPPLHEWSLTFPKEAIGIVDPSEYNFFITQLNQVITRYPPGSPIDESACPLMNCASRTPSLIGTDWATLPS